MLQSGHTTYNVMPFSPVNGPSTFIAFIHNVDSTWKDLARSCGLMIDEDTNTNIIVDDILSWAKTLVSALLYMECQLRVAQSQLLLLSLKKSKLFPQRFEFVGVDVCADGNHPAPSSIEASSVTTLGNPRYCSGCRKICRFPPILLSLHSPF